MLSTLEIGSPLGLVTSRLLSNVEAAEDWAALVGMWTKVGWIPGRKGYKKEKKKDEVNYEFYMQLQQGAVVYSQSGC